MTPEEARARARVLREEAERFRSPEAKAEAHRRAEFWDMYAEEAEGLTGTNHPRTVLDSMGVAEESAEEWRNPPNLTELATMLGCHRSFLSQARSGLTRIRKSWAERIAAVRPDLPATKKTWPKGWAPEDPEK